MAKYQYHGSGPCRVGMTPVNNGDVIDSETNPGKHFRLIEEAPPAPPEPKAPARRRPDEPTPEA